MQFSLGRNRGPSASGSASTTNSSSEQNSRSAAMQKAIERNRAKMASRQEQRSAPGSVPRSAASSMGTPPPMPGATASARPRPMSASASDASESGSSVLAKLRAQRAQREASAAPRPAASASASSSSSASAAPTRKPITQADNIEMSSPLRKKTTAPATVNYADQTPAKAIAKAKTAVSAKRKVKSKSKKKGELTHWGVKLCWAFCLFLLGRLVFSQGGVIEYFDKKSTLDQAYHEVTLLKAENDGLMKELDLIRNNHRYKKKLVRDHLGYIARDEYLILFPETSETSERGLSSI